MPKPQTKPPTPHNGRFLVLVVREEDVKPAKTLTSPLTVHVTADPLMVAARVGDDGSYGGALWTFNKANRLATIDGLRNLANFLEEHPVHD